MAIHNLDQLINQLRRLNTAVERGAAEGLHDEAERVMAESQRRVPRLTGELADSAYVDPPEISGGRVSVEIGYSAPYSTIVHENRAVTHTPPQQAGFLAAAVDATEAGRSERIGRSITTAIRRVLR